MMHWALAIYWLFSMSLQSALAAGTCFIVGDSIAVGLAQQMPECGHSARVGLRAAAIVARVRPADRVIISAGSNDLRNSPALRAALRRARAGAGSGKVLWVLPANGARRAVSAVAAEHGDRTVAFRPARDGVHPSSYRELARAMR